uniref:Uncharacterized protein n=1 Tax=Utricularia reniformis TaxID=192314 RepID=A0A1Y0B3W7_9LAMI|nr:hypothetical protein AEK19_MT1917 [Utricularia reniformis]ART32084.1 hypothetical protein AEK19_MT1917 [Utricularia reniformis]
MASGYEEDDIVARDRSQRATHRLVKTNALLTSNREIKQKRLTCTSRSNLSL